MPSQTASTIDAKSLPVTHDLSITGYSLFKSHQNGKHIKASPFDGGGHRWYMRYYPNGWCANDVGWATFFLFHDYVNVADEVKVKYKITLLDQDGNPVPSFVYHSTTPNRIHHGLIRTRDLEGSAYLRGDAFSVRCEFSVLNVSTHYSPAPLELPSSDLHLRLGLLLSGEELTDVPLEVGGETFRAHRCLLAAQSQVFKSLFTAPMAEKTAASVRIEDMEPRVFNAMLQFMYADQLPTVDEGDRIAMTQHLLVAADRYDLQRLKLVCEEKLRRGINVSTVATSLELAERHDCHGLKDACIMFLISPRSNLKEATKTEGFAQLIVNFPSVVVQLFALVADP